MKQYRTYTIRLFPNKWQKQQLQGISLARNVLYNTLIAIEQQAYKEIGKIKTEYDLDKEITRLRKENPLFLNLNSKASQRVAKEVYSSYLSFFKLKAKDKAANPPQPMKDVKRFHTVVYNQTGWKFIDNEMVKLNGVMLNYKGIPGINYSTLSIKEVKLKCHDGKYLIDLGIENTVKEPETIECENKVLAIDLGIKNLVNGVDNFGNIVTIPNKAKKNKHIFQETNIICAVKNGQMHKRK